MENPNHIVARALGLYKPKTLYLCKDDVYRTAEEIMFLDEEKKRLDKLISENKNPKVEPTSFDEITSYSEQELRDIIRKIRNRNRNSEHNFARGGIVYNKEIDGDWIHKYSPDI